MTRGYNTAIELLEFCTTEGLMRPSNIFRLRDGSIVVEAEITVHRVKGVRFQLNISIFVIRTLSVIDFFSPDETLRKTTLLVENTEIYVSKEVGTQKRHSISQRIRRFSNECSSDVSLKVI